MEWEFSEDRYIDDTFERVISKGNFIEHSLQTSLQIFATGIKKGE